MSAQTIVLERIARVTPLGIRFWDEVTASTVSDSLSVEVYPKDEPERRVAARPNSSGVFVLPRLPGARDLAAEFGAGDEAFWQTVHTRLYVIDVSDRDGVFQPFTIEQRLPARGLAAPPCLPPNGSVPLFSTPSRTVPAGMAVVRAELLTQIPGRVEPSPASWAVLEARVNGLAPVRGVADRDGRVAVIVPYPEPAAISARAGSPPASSSQPLWDQTWTIRLGAFYDPVAPAPLVPDLCRTLTQRPAQLWAGARASDPLPAQTLRYGRELIVRDAFVTTVGSPP